MSLSKKRPRTDKELVEIYRNGLEEAYNDIYDLNERIKDLENLLEVLGIINPKEYEEHRKEYCRKYPKENLDILVKELREITGEGITSCKKALIETEYNIDESVTWLRQHDRSVMI